MKPIGLTDSQLLTIQRAAGPLHPQDGGPYLEKVAEMLSGHEIGDGLVGRVAREAQRLFLRAPEFEPKRVQSRWDRDVPRRQGVRGVPLGHRQLAAQLQPGRAVGNSCPKPRPPSAKRPASARAIRTARRATIVRFLPRQEDYTHDPRAPTSQRRLSASSSA